MTGADHAPSGTGQARCRVLATRLAGLEGAAALIECRLHSGATLLLEFGLEHARAVLEQVGAAGAERERLADTKRRAAARAHEVRLISRRVDFDAAEAARSRQRILRAVRAALDHGPFRPHTRRRFLREQCGLRENEMVAAERELTRCAKARARTLPHT